MLEDARHVGPVEEGMKKQSLAKMTDRQMLQSIEKIALEVKALVCETEVISEEELAFKAKGMDRSIPQSIRVLATEIVLGAFRQREDDAKRRLEELRLLAGEYEVECRRRGF